MKKTFSTRRNALFTSATVSWGVLALLFALCALVFRLVAPNVFLSAEAPLLQSASALGGRSFFSGFSNTAALASRNEELASENAALASENQALHKMAEDHTTLLGAKSERRAGIIAGVLAGPPMSLYDTLVLARGERDGVALGQEAFGEGGVPLGIVSSVSADFSRVTLFSASGAVTRGWVGSANLPLEIRGAGGGALRASVAQAADVALDDAVFVPGPGALPVGRVARIDRDSASPSADILIRGALNQFSITWVELREASPSFADSFSCAAPLP